MQKQKHKANDEEGNGKTPSRFFLKLVLSLAQNLLTLAAVTVFLLYQRPG
jgi:hypothetical protein